MFTLEIAGRYEEGFSQNELAFLLGVHNNTVGRWIKRDWLSVVDGRITQKSVERFVWEHMEEYRFAACEETWLKSMLLANGRTIPKKPPLRLAGIAVALGRIA